MSFSHFWIPPFHTDSHHCIRCTCSEVFSLGNDDIRKLLLADATELSQTYNCLVGVLELIELMNLAPTAWIKVNFCNMRHVVTVVPDVKIQPGTCFLSTSRRSAWRVEALGPSLGTFFDACQNVPQSVFLKEHKIYSRYVTTGCVRKHDVFVFL